MPQVPQIVKQYVLRAISDDYETFDQILHDVTAWVAKRAEGVDRQIIIWALKELINGGYAEAYRLSSGPPGSADAVTFTEQSLDELWFYVTPKGKKYAKGFQKEWRKA